MGKNHGQPKHNPLYQKRLTRKGKKYITIPNPMAIVLVSSSFGL